MSYVTNVILVFSHLPAEEKKQQLNEINDFFKEISKVFETKIGFTLVNNEGGTKCFECSVATGAFNKLDEEGLIEYLRTLEWNKNIDYVQVFMNNQDDGCFKLINIK
jgi:hypothetical protein